MNKYLGAVMLLVFALLAGCAGNATPQVLNVTVTPVSVPATTANVNAEQTRAAASDLATKTAFASGELNRATPTQPAPDISATETAASSGSTTNPSGSSPAATSNPAEGEPAPSPTNAAPESSVPGATPTAAAAEGGQAPPATKTSAPSFPPGLYVNRLRISPAQPKRGQPVTFTATFVNSTGTPQTYRWFVQIYDANTNKGFGETAMQTVSFAVGTHDVASASNWQVSGGGPCLAFYAQAQFQDQDKNRHPFASTDGKVVSYSFQVCP